MILTMKHKANGTDITWGNLLIVLDEEAECVGISPISVKLTEFNFIPKETSPACDFAPSALTQYVVVYQPDKIWNCCQFHQNGGDHTLSCSLTEFEPDDPDAPDCEHCDWAK